MTDFKSLYLNQIQLKAELARCLNCKTKPCMKACPVSCNPQEFIYHAREGNFEEAVKTITRANPMGQTCGLICPDKFCMKACTRSKIDFAVNIPKIQAALLENYRSFKKDLSAVIPNGKKIAVIGAGPAGMAAAYTLAQNGFKSTLFEASSKIGGALNMIPQGRLPTEVIEKDWQYICDERFMTLQKNTRIDDPRHLLQEGFNFVIIATGEPHCINLNIPGEEFSLSYMEYLSHPESYKTTGKVAIIGGGNVAADCALTAQINGSTHVEMFVRRRLSDMRIAKGEYLDLLAHQINITALSSPEKIEKTGETLSLFVRKNHFINGELTPLPNSTIELPGFDFVIRAIGSTAEPKIEEEHIIYAGDCKTGGSTIVQALASGQAAARLIIEKENQPR